MEINARDLSRRLYNSTLERFEYNKRAAINHLRNKAWYFAGKADKYRTCNSPYAQNWSNVYHAYSDAAFTMDYHLELDEEIWDDFDEGWL